MRALSLLILLLIACGCGNESVESEARVGNAFVGGETGVTARLGNSIVSEFCEQFKTFLNNRDWEGLSKLHWSGSGVTPDLAQGTYEAFLSEIKIAERIVVDEHKSYDKTSFRSFADEEEIPGPLSLLRGELEFFIDGPEGTPDSIYIWAFLCEENGELKIFGYIQLTLE